MATDKASLTVRALLLAMVTGACADPSIDSLVHRALFERCEHLAGSQQLVTDELPSNEAVNSALAATRRPIEVLLAPQQWGRGSNPVRTEAEVTIGLDLEPVGRTQVWEFTGSSADNPSGAPCPTGSVAFVDVRARLWSSALGTGRRGRTSIVVELDDGAGPEVFASPLRIDLDTPPEPWATEAAESSGSCALPDTWQLRFGGSPHAGEPGWGRERMTGGVDGLQDVHPQRCEFLVFELMSPFGGVPGE